jgi:chromosomal replication initiation ATPase DnaA
MTFAEAQTSEPRYVLSLWKGRLDAPPDCNSFARAIINEVAALYGLSGGVLCAPSYGRPADIAQARHHAMWALREERHPRRPTEPRWSYPRIASMFWPTMDHTTVIHGVRAHAARIGS